MKKGFTLRHGSAFEHVCNDVVPIALQPIKTEMSTLSDRIAETAKKEAEAKEAKPEVKEVPVQETPKETPQAQ